MIIAIIGTRDINDKTFERALVVIEDYIKSLNQEVHIVSGNAYGMDQIATKLATNYNVTHFIPWDSYNKELMIDGVSYINKGNDTSKDETITKMFPWVFSKSQGFIKLIRRNMFIIKDASLVIWYTGKGVSGGTAYGVKYAKALGIPTIELK